MVFVATPIDLSRVLTIKRLYQRVRYELQEIGQPALEEVLAEAFAQGVGFWPLKKRVSLLALSPWRLLFATGAAWPNVV